MPWAPSHTNTFCCSFSITTYSAVPIRNLYARVKSFLCMRLFFKKGVLQRLTKNKLCQALVHVSVSSFGRTYNDVSPLCWNYMVAAFGNDIFNFHYMNSYRKQLLHTPRRLRKNIIRRLDKSVQELSRKRLTLLRLGKRYSMVELNDTENIWSFSSLVVVYKVKKTLRSPAEYVLFLCDDT